MNTWEIKIYKAKNGLAEIRVRLENESVWLSQEQIANIFGVDRTVITKHINNIFKSWELEKEVVCAKIAHTTKHWAISWKSQTKEINFYNLDMIISIWYRVNSIKATQFRIWATSILKKYLISWYALNQKRLQEKWYKELENTLALVKKAISSWDIGKDEALWLLDIITKYTNTWLLLQKYDEDSLPENGKTKDIYYKLQSKEALESIAELKKDLMENSMATQLFAQERQNWWIEWIFWNIYQTFGWVELYETTEEKAANLLYFIVKDHPFSDGNKRSGAFLFILFLAKNKILFDEAWERKINDRALVAITLLIAESNPKDKDIMVKLVMNLIN